MFNEIPEGARHFLSFGGGVQSTALLMLVLNRDPRLVEAMGGHMPEAALFADPGAESADTYRHIWECAKLAHGVGLGFYVTTAGDIGLDIRSTSRFVDIPVYSIGADGRASMLKRQCTNLYKIKPLWAMIRRLLGLRPRQRQTQHVCTWIGISLDEIQRAKPSRQKHETKLFPLIRMGWRRTDCQAYLAEMGMGRVGKSACVFCPFKSNHEWLRLKREDAEGWRVAVELDAYIRDLHMDGRGGVESPLYLHRSLRPLSDAPIGEDQGDLFDSWDNECEGMCGL